MKAKNEEKGPAVGVIPARLLAAMMECPTTAGTLDSRRVLACVHVRDEGDRVMMETTDGKVLMRAVVQGRKEEAQAPWEGNIPVSLLPVLQGLVAGGAAWLVADDVDKERKQADLSDVGTGSMRVNLFQDKFPECDAVLPTPKKAVRVLLDAQKALAMFKSLVELIESVPGAEAPLSFADYWVTLTLDAANPNAAITAVRVAGDGRQAIGGLLLPVKLSQLCADESVPGPRAAEFPRWKREAAAEEDEAPGVEVEAHSPQRTQR